MKSSRFDHERFTRVVFGVLFPDFNNQVASQTVSKDKFWPSRKLVDSFYIDNIVAGALTADEVFQLYNNAENFKRWRQKVQTNKQSLQLRIEAIENLTK